MSTRGGKKTNPTAEQITTAVAHMPARAARGAPKRKQQHPANSADGKWVCEHCGKAYDHRVSWHYHTKATVDVMVEGPGGRAVAAPKTQRYCRDQQPAMFLEHHSHHNKNKKTKTGASIQPTLVVDATSGAVVSTRVPFALRLLLA